MGLFGFGRKKPANPGKFSFTIEDTFAMRAGGCVVAGQVTSGEYVHPDTARADGPWEAHYSFLIPDRSKTDFHPGDRLISGNE